MAYLICHYADDLSIGSNWVTPSRIDERGTRVNIIDDRAEGNKAKPEYTTISQEIGQELGQGDPMFVRMDTHDAMALVSHMIERRLTEIIRQKTGEVIDPLCLPELVDQKIREAIENQS